MKIDLVYDTRVVVGDVIYDVDSSYTYMIVQMQNKNYRLLSLDTYEIYSEEYETTKDLICRCFCGDEIKVIPNDNLKLTMAYY